MKKERKHVKSQRLGVQAEGTIWIKAQRVGKKKNLDALRKLRRTHVGEESEPGACDPVGWQ